ncbi:MAG: HYR domain-containing protein [Planctomycetes bacterium]|nr:HYR domain-containing protein [Planctomycetota bacterium]
MSLNLSCRWVLASLVGCFALAADGFAANPSVFAFALPLMGDPPPPGGGKCAPPTITCPPNIQAECTGVGGAAVAFTVTASSDCVPEPTITCTPESGSLFPLGRTQVCCVALDSQKNTAECCFFVTVTPSTSSHLATAVLGQPASALIFPLFDSRSGQGTIITVTNTDSNRDTCRNRLREGDVCLRYTYFAFDPASGSCLEFDRTECLTPGDTLTVVADQHDPEGDVGWLWVEARDPETDEAIDFNHLIGSAIVVNVGLEFMFQYHPYGFRSYTHLLLEPPSDACGHAFTDVDGDNCADFDGVEYDFWPQRLLLDEFFQQGDGRQGVDNVLTLISCDLGHPTIVSAHPWNNNEHRFSATFDFECFFNEPFSPGISHIFEHLKGGPNELVGFGHHIQLGWLELDANKPILGVYHQHLVASPLADGTELQFAGQFGGPCDGNPDHEPCCLRRD